MEVRKTTGELKMDEKIKIFEKEDKQRWAFDQEFKPFICAVMDMKVGDVVRLRNKLDSLAQPYTNFVAYRVPGAVIYTINGKPAVVQDD